MTTLIINIRELLQASQTSPDFRKGTDMMDLPIVENAWLLIKDDKIENFGGMDTAPDTASADRVIDAEGKVVLPTWVDSHTHIVFAGSREGEFVDKINGLSYEEIAARGGGILNSANRLGQTSEDELYEQSKVRLEELMKMGTGAVEIKSGYGLTVENEIKMLRVIKRLRQDYPITIKSTFLGAHAFPKEYKQNQEAYIDKIINEMLPIIEKEGLADYIDVFCEKGFFNPEQTARILQAGKAIGLTPKIHANQLSVSGGVQVGVENDALSVDHLEEIDDAVIESLQGGNTVATVLPSCSFYLGIPFAPARKMVDAGLGIAVATDYNPGSTPSGRMQFVVSLACIKMKLNPEEAINAATVNAAYAMGLEDSHGSITPGKTANFIITPKIPNFNFIPYAFGSDLMDQVFIAGKEVKEILN